MTDQNTPAEQANDLAKVETSPETETAAIANRNEPSAADEDLSLIAEFGIFLRENKIWWITPIVLALLLIITVAYLSKSADSPFIYPLF